MKALCVGDLLVRHDNAGDITLLADVTVAHEETVTLGRVFVESATLHARLYVSQFTCTRAALRDARVCSREEFDSYKHLLLSKEIARRTTILIKQTFPNDPALQSMAASVVVAEFAVRTALT